MFANQKQSLPIRKQNGRWAKNTEEKAERFAAHFSKVFEPYPREITLKEENRLFSNANIPAKMIAPARFFTIKDVRATRELNLRKTPSYVLITNQVLQKIPEKGIKFITQLCNAVLRGDFSPFQ